VWISEMAFPGARRVHGWLSRVVLIVVALYLCTVAAFVLVQRSLVYPALRTGPLTAANHPVEGADCIDVTAKTSDGLTLHGWHIRPAVETSGDRPVVLMFHGNGGHRAQGLQAAGMFCALGAEVLLFDYRGYGENAGRPSEQGLRTDAQAMWDYATGRMGVPARQIVLYGESLGGGVAVRLAADLCQSGTRPAGLILCNTFTSLADVAAHRFPWLPVRTALLDRYDSERRIGDVVCPLLVLHGDADGSIPHAFGRRLFDAASRRTSIHRRFVTLAGAGHNDMLSRAADAYRSAIESFVRDLTAEVPEG
jgi:uncharacterized protein